MYPHDLRKKIDECIYEIENIMKTEPMAITDEGRARGIVRTKLQEAKMWTGKILEAQNSELPEEFRDECKARTGEVCEKKK